MDPMLERALHAAVVVLLLALGAAALKWWQKRKAGNARSLLTLEPGKPALVYFHSPTCGVCRTSQKPTLDRVVARLGQDRLQLVTVDVSERTELARAWGVATVPTVFVLGTAGEVAHVNNGLVGEAALWRQLSLLGAQDAGR